MTSHRPAAPSLARLSELDSLRGIAAFLVLLQHARVMGLDPRPFDNPLLERGGHMLMHFSPIRVLEFGRPAVLFFFVLSGYVLTRALLRTGSPGLPAFAAQRTVRLMLPAAASVLLSAGLYAALVAADPALLAGELRAHTLHLWEAAPGLTDILRAGTLLLTESDRVQLNPVLWSLVHEWRLTLLLPLVLLFRGRVWWLLALGCVGMALGALGSGSENRLQLGPQFHSTVVASLYFSLAVASGAALAMAGPLPSLTREQRLAAGVAALVLLGLSSDVAVYIGAVLLIVVAQQPGRLRNLLRSGPLVWLGHVSYSLYLVHAPVLAASVVLLHERLPIWACVTIGAAVALPAAEAMHRLVEAPSRDLARWAERRLRRRPARRGAAGQPAGEERREATWAGEGGLFVDPAAGGGRGGSR
jgi:peptidoglycan/LPS O-acetylase OafA/YrhL